MPSFALDPDMVHGRAGGAHSVPLRSLDYQEICELTHT